ncbi:MAG: hypothetical protein JWP58_541 [Hymenobacter sp.]|nr:hypothetical protein [Hymenobacter sp.]
MDFYIEGDGRITAATDQELLEKLRQNGMGLAPTASVPAFMEGMAARAHEEKQVNVRTDLVRTFLFDLQVQGYLTSQEPWRALAVDPIRQGLLGPDAPSGWQHQLVWSSELPFIVSTRGMAGVHTALQLPRLQDPAYQQEWLKYHIHELLLHE